MAAGWVLAASSLISGASQAQAIEAQGEYQKRQADLNARMAERNAEDSIRRGHLDANRMRFQGKKIRAAQRTSLAAQGIEMTSGSAADIQEETLLMSETDAITIENNAFLEAMGFKTEAINQRAAGRFAQAAAGANASNTMITGALNATAYGMSGFKARSSETKDTSSEEYFGNRLRMRDPR